MKIATRPSPWPLLAACAATLDFIVVVAWAGAMLEGYSQFVHPVELPGASGMPHATAFNVLAFVVPGLLVACVAVACYARSDDRAPMPARIGAWISLFSAVAFMGLGLLPLDPGRLDAHANRLHSVAWSLWWLTSAAGASFAFIGDRVRRSVARLVAAWLVPGFALFAPVAWGAAISQRLAFAAWFAWWLLAALALSRNAPSTPGSSQPGRR